MAEETKSTAKSPAPSAPGNAPSAEKTPAAPAVAGAVQNGKGDAPRNCFSDSYRSNFDQIDWGR